MGPAIAPEKRVEGYEDGEFEDFIRDWAFLCLQKSGVYEGVRRFGGSGDLGRDIVAYLEMPLKTARFDVYQCKHYAAKLTPGVMWPEFAKLCVFTHLNRFPIPRRYFIVAPRDVGTKLGDFIDNPETLRAELLTVWKDKCASVVTKGVTYELEGGLLEHIQSFPFAIIRCKPIHEVIEDFTRCPRYAGRFGGGLKPFPPDELPPATVHEKETRYVAHLLAAYSEVDGQTFKTVADVLASKYKLDLDRQRERYYCAETLRRFARDNEPSAARYEDIAEQMYHGVIDGLLGTYPTGYDRMLQTMTNAGKVQITNHPLRSYLKPQSKQGICHQLANADRISWVLEDK